jgi:hypothetical protein
VINILFTRAITILQPTKSTTASQTVNTTPTHTQNNISMLILRRSHLLRISQMIMIKLQGTMANVKDLVVDNPPKTP